MGLYVVVVVVRFAISTTDDLETTFSFSCAFEDDHEGKRFSCSKRAMEHYAMEWLAKRHPEWYKITAVLELEKWFVFRNVLL